MLKEIGHFIRIGKELTKLQKQYPPAQFVDIMSAKADDQGYAEVRRELVGDLTGKILEIGCGTGAMFKYYGAHAQVEAVEPDADFLALAVKKASEKIHAAPGDGMELPFTEASFDAVVLGLVLCSVASVPQVLAESFRVLDHVRSEAAVPGFLMDLINPLWRRFNGVGCNWNRNPIDEIHGAGFRVDNVMAFKRFDTVMPAFPMRRVRAHKS
jgi:SAM-dependent methyltransferase